MKSELRIIHAAWHAVATIVICITAIFVANLMVEEQKIRNELELFKFYVNNEARHVLDLQAEIESMRDAE